MDYAYFKAFALFCFSGVLLLRVNETPLLSKSCVMIGVARRV